MLIPSLPAAAMIPRASFVPASTRSAYVVLAREIGILEDFRAVKRRPAGRVAIHGIAVPEPQQARLLFDPVEFEIDERLPGIERRASPD